MNFEAMLNYMKISPLHGKVVCLFTNNYDPYSYCIWHVQFYWEQQKRQLSNCLLCLFLEIYIFRVICVYKQLLKLKLSKNNEKNVNEWNLRALKIGRWRLNGIWFVNSICLSRSLVRMHTIRQLDHIRVLVDYCSGYYM